MADDLTPLPKFDRFEWTSERVATVRKIAEDGGTAFEAAAAINLEPERAYLLYALAVREGFKFTNTGRKRSDRVLITMPSADISKLLRESARKHGHDHRDHAAKLLAIVLQQGPTFIDNLLSDE